MHLHDADPENGPNASDARADYEAYHYLDDTATITMPERSASFVAIVLRNRIEEIEHYHEDHPELPRQDDILHVYQVALQAVNAALPNYARS